MQSAHDGLSALKPGALALFLTGNNDRRDELVRGITNFDIRVSEFLSWVVFVVKNPGDRLGVVGIPKIAQRLARNSPLELTLARYLEKHLAGVSSKLEHL